MDEYRELKEKRERRYSHQRGSESDVEEKIYPDAKLLEVRRGLNRRDGVIA